MAANALIVEFSMQPRPPTPPLPPIPTITEAEVRRLEKIRDLKKQRSLVLQETRTSLLERRQELQDTIRRCKSVRRFRARFDATSTRTGGYLCTVAAVAAATLVVTDFFGIESAALLTWVTTAGTAGVLGLRLFFPGDDELNARIDQAERELGGGEFERLDLDREITLARSAFDRAEAAFKSASAFHRSRINELRRVAWGEMRGVEFEEFLADVFREHGYAVETTKVTGDQGVDLVLTRNGRRFAVQAKGYPSSTVGNSAVQEAFTGAAFYKCDVAVVVTNSTYTASAREAAAQVGCRLIGGDEITGLIEGTVTL